MWTLQQTKLKLQDRLAETGTSFWSDLDSYINEAQRYISALTEGVPYEITATIDNSNFTITLPEKFLGTFDDGFYTSTNRSLKPIPHAVVQSKFPNWRQVRGNPRWIAFDVEAKKAYVFPIAGVDVILVDENSNPLTDLGTLLHDNDPYTVTGQVAVLPNDLSSSTDELFNGQDIMEKYQGAVVNYAAVLALLKERYDGDAERFYQFFVQELQSLGVAPERIPGMKQMVEDAQGRAQ